MTESCLMHSSRRSCLEACCVYCKEGGSGIVVGCNDYRYILPQDYKEHGCTAKFPPEECRDYYTDASNEYIHDIIIMLGIVTIVIFLLAMYCIRRRRY